MKGGFARGLAVVAIGAAATLAGGGAAAQAATSTATGWCGMYGYDCHHRDPGLVGVIEDTVTGLVGDRFGYHRPYFPGFF